MGTTTNITPQALAAYRTTMQQRGEQDKKARQERQKLAHQIAHQASKLLKEEFDVTKVVLFGSLAHQHWFSHSSDIDLAVWGLTKSDYFLAVARLQELSTEFKIDLVDINNCSVSLYQVIQREGQIL
ncbi:MAG: nucleotidyltransferase domain-containing protein [Ardenticatenaceae bacterium]|nr:nucleotidyltransferase domain-containing protein [Ardenticatenaceae bacterium]